jgi:hypothetical protein
MEKRRVNMFAGAIDKNGNKLYSGDTVSLYGLNGMVTYNHGSFGIGFTEEIDWDLLKSKIVEEVGTTNPPMFCFNDNFVSFWELAWNYECSEDNYPMVELLSDEKREDESDKLNELSIVVEGGKIIAVKSMDSNYPGIDVEFIPEVIDETIKSNPRVLLEKPKGENCRVYVWGDKNNEDFTFKTTFN